MPHIEIEALDQLWNYADPAASEQRFRQLLPVLAEDPANTVELLSQIARAQGLQGQFAAGHATLDQAEGRLAQVPARARVRYLLERGRLFNSAGDAAQARPLFLSAWEQASAAGELSYAIDAAHMLAIVEPPDQQIAWNTWALEHAQQSNDPAARRWIGSLLNNLGWTYHALGQYERALELFQRAVQWRAEQGQAHELSVARWCVGRVLRSLGRLDEALALQWVLLEEAQRSAAEPGFVYEELAEGLLARGRVDEAAFYFARAYAVLAGDRWLASQEPERLARLKRLGQGQDG